MDWAHRLWRRRSAHAISLEGEDSELVTHPYPYLQVNKNSPNI